MTTTIITWSFILAAFLLSKYDYVFIRHIRKRTWPEDKAMFHEVHSRVFKDDPVTRNYMTMVVNSDEVKLIYMKDGQEACSDFIIQKLDYFVKFIMDKHHRATDINDLYSDTPPVPPPVDVVYAESPPYTPYGQYKSPSNQSNMLPDGRARLYGGSTLNSWEHSQINELERIEAEERKNKLVNPDNYIDYE